jgi:hypothetical protein
MKRRYWLAGALILISVGVLAYFLAGEVRDYVLLPLAYQLWVLWQVYRTVPQQLLWMVIVLVLLYLTVSIFYGTSLRKSQAQQQYDFRGAVESLSVAITNRSRGIYFKWRLANILANVAAYILKAQERRLPGRRLTGRDWNPPPGVEAFLDAGINTTFADYPVPGFFQPPPETPFDIDLEPVVAFLESELEMDKHDSHRS